MIVIDPETGQNLQFCIDAVKVKEFLRTLADSNYVCTHDRQWGPGEFQHDARVIYGGELNLAMRFHSLEDAKWYARESSMVVPSFAAHRQFLLQCLDERIDLLHGGPLLTSTFVRGRVKVISGPFSEKDRQDRAIARGHTLSKHLDDETILSRPLLRLARPG